MKKLLKSVAFVMLSVGAVCQAGVTVVELTQDEMLEQVRVESLTNTAAAAALRAYMADPANSAQINRALEEARQRQAVIYNERRLAELKRAGVVQSTRPRPESAAVASAAASAASK